MMDLHSRATSYRLKENLVRERVKESLSDAVGDYGIDPPSDVYVRWEDEILAFRIRTYYHLNFLEIMLDEHAALNMPDFLAAEMAEHIACTASIEIAERL